MPQGWLYSRRVEAIFYFLLILINLLIVGGIGTVLIGRWAKRRVKEIYTARKKSFPAPKPSHPIPISNDNDLLNYPRRLEQLEEQLGDRIIAIEDQARVMQTRLAELSGKDGRQGLTRKYQDDAQLLARRSEGMRRVLGQVWKTRAVLLLRVHLATTARHKPALDLPPTDHSLPPRQASETFHVAAAAIQNYLEEIHLRRKNLKAVLPAPPALATLEDLQEVVQQEYLASDQAYQNLLGQMDQLSDNLTWLGDHFATMAVVVEGSEAIPEAGASHLFAEVDKALDALDALATSVDSNTLDQAVDHLSQDISRLEIAGQEVSAEADAGLEVDRLLKRSVG